MQISTSNMGEGIYEGLVQEKDDWYVLAQTNRHAYLAKTSESSLKEYEDDFAAVRGHLSAQFSEPEGENPSTIGEFYLDVLEIGEVLGQTDDGRVVTRFDDGIYVSEYNRFDPDETGNDYDLGKIDLPIW
ncbi:MAG: hypothetical protein ACI977_000790 [Candidatus Nanohaloarchaea archaeon]|jgi:hypothetical protein